VAGKRDDQPRDHAFRAAHSQHAHLWIDGASHADDLGVMRRARFARMRDLAAIAHEKATIERQVFFAAAKPPASPSQSSG
jgi:hypothetical protein